MTHTRLLPILAACLLAASPSLASDDFLGSIEMIDVEIVYTIGTQVAQRVEADVARMAPDGESILADSVQLTSEPQNDEDPLVVTAPEARVYHAAPSIPFGMTPGAPIELPDLTALRAAATHGPDPGFVYKNEIYMRGNDTEQVVARLGDSGVLTSPSLLWSEWHLRFIAPQGFRQVAQSEDGGNYTVTGDVFATDRDFLEWTYFDFPGGEPGLILHESQEEPNE
jgi:hypothetical protein